MSICSNCGKEFSGSVYPLYCSCGHVTGSDAELHFSASTPNLWREWHQRLAAAILLSKWNSANEQDWFLRDWSPRIPSVGCDCKKHWDKLVKRIGIDWSTAETAFASSVRLHSAVSREQSRRPEMSLDQAKFLYLGTPPTRDRCIVTVATGAKFRELLNASRPSMMRYAAKCNADYYELTDSQFSDWKREKFRVHEFAKAYERTLFLDSDLWVRESCPDLFAMYPSDAVVMHDDFIFNGSSGWINRERALVFASQGITDSSAIDHCYNSGVVLCSRSTADTWLPPVSPLPARHCAEQFLVEWQSLRYRVIDLPTEFNCQFWLHDFAARVDDAHIVHLAACPTKLQAMRKFAS